MSGRESWESVVSSGLESFFFLRNPALKRWAIFMVSLRDKSIRYPKGIGLCPSLLMVLMAAGCATAPVSTLPQSGHSFPGDALITQRGVLTVRGRQFTLNGYLARNSAGAMRLIVTQNFGGVLADVLIKPDGTIHVMRSSSALKPEWISRYIVADVQCIFGDAPTEGCPGRKLSETHFVIERRPYTLDLQIVETKAGLQPPEMFDETGKVAP